MSFSNKIKSRNKAQSPTKPRIVRAPAMYSDPIELKPELVVNEAKNNYNVCKYDVCFIADCSVTMDLKRYNEIIEIDKRFINLNYDDIVSKTGKSVVWLNLTNSDTKAWAQINLVDLSKKTCVISVDSLNCKRAKYKDDVKEYVEYNIRLSDLLKIQAFNFGDLIEKIMYHLRVHTPPQKLDLCMNFLSSMLCNGKLKKDQHSKN